jgi:protein-S-isoprenylcysteine O-methyltransferase Ste14
MSNLITIVISGAYCVSVVWRNLDTVALLVALPYLLSALAPLIMLVASVFSRPIRTDERWRMFFIALIASNLFAVLHFAGVELVNPHRSLPLAFAATLATFALTPPYVYAVFVLGRQLTVMPEARKLITRGPYSISRHPLYAIYFLWFLLLIAIVQTLVILILAVAMIVLQLLRALAEEALLERTFPEEYAAYRRRVGWIWRWRAG